MSAVAKAQLAVFVEAQRARFVEGLAARLGAIEGEWRALTERPDDRDIAQRLAVAAHSIAGAAPMFGLGELGEAARVVQREAEALAEGSASLAERSGALARAMTRLLTCVRK